MRSKGEKIHPKQAGLFYISGNNWGLGCPFKPIICKQGYCEQCPIYHDWQKLGEILIVCAWCSKVMRREPGLGQSGISHGICPECQEKHFPKTLGQHK